MSLELIELQSFSAASTPTGSCTKSAPWECILKLHCREGAGAATRASHHTGLCVQAMFSQHIRDSPAKGLTNYLEVLQSCIVKRPQTQQP